MRRKITHRLIAAECGVACSTVTRVLTGSPSVAPETRELVLETAKRLGYRSSARSGRPVLIAVVYTWIAVKNIYDTQLVEMIERAVRMKGWHIVLIPGDSLSLLDDWIFPGIISIAYNKKIEKVLAEKTNIPIVVINSFPRHIERIYSTYSDEESAVTQGIAHLRSLGHSRVAVFSRPPTPDSFTEKTRYRASLLNMEKQNPKAYFFIDDLSDLKDELIRAKKDGFTAGILMFEVMPVLLQHILDSLDFRIPEDFSLITKEVWGMSQYLKPAPTSFEQNLETLANNAVSMIEQIMKGKESDIRDVPVENIFHPRATTAPPPGKGISPQE